jgi:hypothetical protein
LLGQDKFAAVKILAALTQETGALKRKVRRKLAGLLSSDRHREQLEVN